MSNVITFSQEDYRAAREAFDVEYRNKVANLDAMARNLGLELIGQAPPVEPLPEVANMIEKMRATAATANPRTAFTKQQPAAKKPAVNGHQPIGQRKTTESSAWRPLSAQNGRPGGSGSGSGVGEQELVDAIGQLGDEFTIADLVRKFRRRYKNDDSCQSSIYYRLCRLQDSGLIGSTRSTGSATVYHKI